MQSICDNTRWIESTASSLTVYLYNGAEGHRNADGNHDGQGCTTKTNCAADIVVPRSLICRTPLISVLSPIYPSGTDCHLRSLSHSLFVPVFPGLGAVTVPSEPAFPPFKVVERVFNGVCDVDVFDDVAEAVICRDGNGQCRFSRRVGEKLTFITVVYDTVAFCVPDS